MIDFYLFYGVLTGLIPSIHPNNLVNLVPKEHLIEITIVHSFINFIPNILFLIPDVYTVTSLNSSQIFYKRGLAFYALILSGISSFLAGIFSLIFYLSPFIFFYLNNFYYLTCFILIIPIILPIFLRKSLKNLLIFIFLFFSFYFLISLTKKLNLDYFLPITGLFGLSSVFVFGNRKIIQRLDFKLIKLFFDLNLIRKILAYSILGVLLSIPANVFPLLTPTHLLLLLVFLIKFGLEESIILVSSISTSDFVLSIITKQFYGYSRNFVVSNAVVNNIYYVYLIKLYIFSILIYLLISILFLWINNLLPRVVINIFIIFSIFLPFLINKDLNSILVLLSSGILGYFAIKNNIERISLFNSYLFDYVINFIKR